MRGLQSLLPLRTRTIQMSALCFHSLNTQARGVAAAFDHGRVVALSLNILCRSHPVAHIAACRYVISARHGARKCTSLGNGQAMSMAKVGQHKRPGLEG